MPEPANNLSGRVEETALEHWMELIAAILMAVAVVLSAYSAYEATRWGGVQATDFASAGSLRTEATTETTVGTTELSYDAQVFATFVLEFRDADFDDPETRAGVLDLADDLMRDDFKPFLDEWLALEPDDNPDAPRTPFDLPSFENDNLVEAEALRAEAESTFEEAKQANQNGDDYILATIFFASVLFFAGISPKFKSLHVRGTVLAFAAIGLTGGLIRIAMLPFE